MRSILLLMVVMLAGCRAASRAPTATAVVETWPMGSSWGYQDSDLHIKQSTIAAVEGFRTSKISFDRRSGVQVMRTHNEREAISITSLFESPEVLARWRRAEEARLSRSGGGYRRIGIAPSALIQPGRTVFNNETGREGRMELNKTVCLRWEYELAGKRRIMLLIGRGARSQAAEVVTPGGAERARLLLRHVALRLPRIVHP